MTLWRLPRSRGFPLAMMGALAVVLIAGAAGGAFLPEILFSSAIFLAVAGILGAGMVVSLIARLPAARSLRAWGSVLLHGSVPVLMVGVIYNESGSVARTQRVTEGDSVSLPLGDTSIRVDRLRAFHREGAWRKGDAAELTIMRRGRVLGNDTIRVNAPLRRDGYAVHLSRHGFSPYLEVRGPNGVPLYRGFVPLETMFGEDGVRYWGRFRLPTAPLSAVAVFRPSADGPFPRDPRLKLTLKDDDGRVVFAGNLSMKDRVFDGGYEVFMGEVRYWAGLLVRRDPGLGLIFAGFWMAIAGSAAALLPRAFGRHA